MQSKIQFISNAMVLLGGNTVNSLDDGSTEAQIGASLYESTYNTMLSTHRWRFCTKTQVLSKLSQETKTKYKNAFSLPSDMIYLIKADFHDYEIYGSTLHSNADSVKIDYTFRVDESVLPPAFVKALEFNLAAQFAVPLTGDLNKADFYGKAYLNSLRVAKYNDSSQRPGDTFIDSPYTEARY